MNKKRKMKTIDKNYPMAKAKIVISFLAIFMSTTASFGSWTSGCLRHSLMRESHEQKNVCRAAMSRQRQEKDENTAIVAVVCIAVGGVIKLFGGGLHGYWPAERALFVMCVMIGWLLVWCYSVFFRNCDGNHSVERLKESELQRGHWGRNGHGL